MFSAFTSFGATAFNLTLTNIDGDKIPTRHTPAWMRPMPGTGRLPDIALEQLRGRIQRVLMEAESNRHNVIIRPRSTAATLIQLDDLNRDQVEKLSSHAFIGFQTSPANYQAWVAVEQKASEDFSPRLRKGTGADPTASGSTRIAASRNFKPKYAPAFPNNTSCPRVERPRWDRLKSDSVGLSGTGPLQRKPR